MLQLVFDRPKEHCFKLRPSMCQFVKKEVQYLGGIENVLIVTDNFSLFAQAYPTKDQKACTLAKVL